MSIGEKIYSLRTKMGISQEKMAEIFNVSRQSVQKWESNASFPETAKLIEIAKYFNISLDSLLLDRSSRFSEELNNRIIPSYEELHKWELYGSQLDCEYTQCVDEGKDIEQYKNLFSAVAELPQSEIKAELSDTIYKIVLNAPVKEGYKYNEPSALHEIQALRKAYTVCGKAENLKDKVLGAWLGRVCGCMLGKSVEGIHSDELIRFLKETDNYPMKRYILRSDLERVNLSDYNFGFLHRVYADEIDGMPVDDDTNYTILAQLIIEKYGFNFTPNDVADAWLASQVKSAYCTAERVAYCNFVKGYKPPYSAMYKNTYREWIGAQIRGDYWGYINPGNPEAAAEMAYRDACVSHVKNGIYGEMFVAAMLATAAVTNNIPDIVLSGLSQIPYTSRLHEDVMHIFELYKNGNASEKAFKYVNERYDECTGYGWCHTISNAMIVVASLLYGKGDFERSVCMAVEHAFDTDCNGATVGSILGMANGATRIPKAWKSVFNDKLNTSVFGVEDKRISEYAEITLQHIEKNPINGK